MASTSNVRQLFRASPVLLDKEEEQKLVKACLDGNRRAMEKLVRLYERPVYNVAFRLLGNAEDAADATQTTFLKVFQKLGQFDPQYKFFSWVYRIAMNEAFDMLKQRARNEPLGEERATENPGPSDEASAAQTSEQLRRAMLELSDDYRSVIALKYFTGCSYGHMAKILGVPEKTVKSRLYTARQNLRDILVRYGYRQS